MSSRNYIITTVTVPAASANMTTSATVMADWQIPSTESAFVTRAVARCSAAAANYCNRRFGVTTYSCAVNLEFGYRDGHLTLGAKSPLVLPYWPIASITSIVETDANGTSTTLVAGTDYEFQSETGMVWRLDSMQRQRDWLPTNKVVVVYKAGYVMPDQNPSDFPGVPTLPVEIEDAVGRMVSVRYFARIRDPLIKSERAEGIGQIDYIVQTTAEGNMTPDVTDILDNYRMPIVG